MKPTNERNQAATQVNALCPEIFKVVDADSLGKLEGRINIHVKGSVCISTGVSGSSMVTNGITWEPGGVLKLLCEKKHI